MTAKQTYCLHYMWCIYFVFQLQVVRPSAVLWVKSKHIPWSPYGARAGPAGREGSVSTRRDGAGPAVGGWPGSAKQGENQPITARCFPGQERQEGAQRKEWEWRPRRQSPTSCHGCDCVTASTSSLGTWSGISTGTWVELETTGIRDSCSNQHHWGPAEVKTFFQTTKKRI